MLDKITAYIEKWNMLESNDNVIVGISGGADSVCLLFVLYKLKEVMHIDITGIHVNHGLREEAADRDEAFVRQFCSRLDIPCAVYRRDVGMIAKQRKQSEEEAGRDARREVFAEALKTYGGTRVALAHHKNDNAETMLMNLARGTGLRGLSGMKPLNGQLIRPLLCVTRQEIERFLAKEDISYCDDVTNRSDLYTRNRIRNHVMPYLEDGVNLRAVEHIADTMERLRTVQEYLDDQADIWYRDCIRFQNQDIILVGKNFEAVPAALKPLILQRIMTESAGAGKDITARHLAAAGRLLEQQTGRRISLPYGMTAVRCYEGIRFSQATAAGNKTGPVGLPVNGEVKVGSRLIRTKVKEGGTVSAISCKKHYTKQFDYDIIKSNVSIRTREAGDYIVIDDQGNRQKLKAFFINNKVPREVRENILLIAEGSHVLWIIGMRQSKAYQINAYTKRILEIEIEEVTEDKNGRDNQYPDNRGRS